MGFWSYLVRFFSFEWLLTSTRLTNGGDVILLRSLLSTVFLYTSILAIKNFIDPSNTMMFNYQSLGKEFVATVQWFGAIFASIYAALYTRFASQWRYMADLYNKIKETEAKYPNPDMNAINAWKAGFIEDALELHLSTKGLFASIISVWGKNPEVKLKFVEATGLKEEAFCELMERVDAAYEKHKKKWQ